MSKDIRNSKQAKDVQEYTSVLQGSCKRLAELYRANNKYLKEHVEIIGASEDLRVAVDSVTTVGVIAATTATVLTGGLAAPAVATIGASSYKLIVNLASNVDKQAALKKINDKMDSMKESEKDALKDFLIRCKRLQVACNEFRDLDYQLKHVSTIKLVEIAFAPVSRMVLGDFAKEEMVKAAHEHPETALDVSITVLEKALEAIDVMGVEGTATAVDIALSAFEALPIINLALCVHGLSGVQKRAEEGGQLNEGLAMMLAQRMKRLNYVEITYKELARLTKEGEGWLGFTFKERCDDSFFANKKLDILLVHTQSSVHAGVRVGQKIRKIGNSNVSTYDDTQKEIKKYEIGEIIPLTIKNNCGNIEKKMVQVEPCIGEFKLTTDFWGNKFSEKVTSEGWLGLGFKEREDGLGNMKLDVLQVYTHSAWKAGVCAGHKIKKIGNVDVFTKNDMLQEVKRYDSGDTVTMTIKEDGGTHNEYQLVVLEKQSQGEDCGCLGITFQERKDGAGIMKLDVLKVSQSARQAGVREGHKIKKIGNIDVFTEKDILEEVKLYDIGFPVTLTLKELNGTHRTYTLNVLESSKMSYY